MNLKISGVFCFLISALLVSGCVSTREVKREVLQVQVEDGDTLNSIAKQFDTDWRMIVKGNRDTLQKGLRVGQVLNVVPGNGATTTVRVSHKQDQLEEIVDDQDDEDIKFTPKNRGLLFGGNKSKEEMSFIFPVEGRITSHFGKRGRRLHKGIDISANVGTPIVATADGEVIFSGKRRGYGGTVVVDHGSFVSLYAHCSVMGAKVGDTVSQGDYIAKSGRSGNARGAHLHFEIRDSGNRPIDPEPLLRHRTVAQNKRSKSLLFGKSLVGGKSDRQGSQRGLFYATK